MLPFHPTYSFVANGAIENDLVMRPRIQAHQGLVAFDGGLLHCLRIGLRPDLIVGDLDSIPSEVLDTVACIPKRVFPPDKDKSDLELALQSCYTPKIERIIVFGALGKRLDHTLSNVHLMRRYPNKFFSRRSRNSPLLLMKL